MKSEVFSPPKPLDVGGCRAEAISEGGQSISTQFFEATSRYATEYALEFLKGVVCRAETI
jgi:hypothetical protein